MGINKPIERKQQTYKQLFTKTTIILKELHNKGDHTSARKVAELAQKVIDQDLTIAFCGHFSAGKSSFINEILQESILPASPIPTSANVVKIQKGEERAHVYFFEGEALEILPPVLFENVKAYCKDGDQVESVSYQYPFTNLPDDLIVLDTPGVDSTDDAHRVSTESALHLADVIFYVMDYNHVQSEVNLKFIKELQDKEKKIYLVVNQIDKHREEEIAFETYQKRIQESFADWGIEPVSLYYTSLMEESHPLNDVKIVKETIQLLIDEKKRLLPITVESALHHIVEEHKKWLMDCHEEELEQLTAIVEDSQSDFAGITSELKVKKEEWHKVEAEGKEKKENFINETNRILENANITPFEMRELAQKYLESQQKGFKVGLLFSGKKTLEEKEARLSVLMEDLTERVGTQIEKFVHEHIYTFLKENDLYHPTVFEQVQSITLEINEEFVAGQVKFGAGATGEAVLQYTKELAQAVKLDYRKKVQQFMEKVFVQLDELLLQKNQKTKSEIEILEGQHQAYQKISHIKMSIEETLDHLFAVLYEQSSEEVSEISSQPDLMEQYLKRVYTQINGANLSVKKERISGSMSAEEKKAEAPLSQQQELLHPKYMSKVLNQAATYMKDLHGFQTVIEDLKKRANKLEDQSFTVALFGAFSAGKSSFANALLGENILPVSPNPTTASINKISPVTPERPHGTVCIQMKTSEQLLLDVQQALSFFNSSIGTMEEANTAIKKIIQKNAQKELPANIKPHFHFLKAFNSGWDQMETHLGSLLMVSLEEFPGYVAEEEKSCFVEWIEVFYDCPLTQEGLTLVDTPGADSINARHTDVAFEYIKNADAILFVTYYQHAFSKADREFLIQLGRIKDAFSLDKMFFLVNAADLAQNEDELELVCSYVEEQLMLYGIRNPRLFPVSSLLALKEKEGKSFTHAFLPNSLMGIFEKEFLHFIQHDLVSMSIHAANLEINRADALLENYIKESRLGKEEKEAKRELLLQNKVKIEHVLSEYSIGSYQTLLSKEVKELLYYVKHRTLLRFSDFFKEAFNPSVLRDDGRNIKEQLILCVNEFLSDISLNLSQEVRATTVRLENYLSSSLNKWQEEVEIQMKKIEEQLSFSQLDVENIQSMKVEAEFPSMSIKAEKQAISYYRNAKAFFEKNDKQKLQEFLEIQITPLMDQYLEVNVQELDSHYQTELQHSFVQVKSDLKQQLEEYFRGMQAVLSDTSNVEELQAVREKMQLLKR
ncbi:dynamin family protein [Sutcliffiella deserti]|uniref:dynamin family protein n=1 Tax=Sutcliffiella deserti TaxID=2875501 RepID=UPI001CBA969C|nr:dynamin family protein [Sutcliffiella deserti]